MKDIVTVRVPVPIPEIRKFSRWEVFKALFDRNAHFTTCESLRHQLHVETIMTTQHMVDTNLNVQKTWGSV